MHHLEIIEAINSFPIAESLNNHDLHLLVEQGELKVFNKSEYVYRQGEPSDKIFFLLKGVVKIASNLSEGREIIKMVVHPRAILSEESFAGENIRSSNAVSLTQDVTCLLYTSVNLGINYSLVLSENDKKYSSIQPRFAFLADGENLHFKIGASKMQQYIHLLSNSGLGLPADVWLPSSDILAPQESWNFNTSFGYRLNSGVRFGADVYYKSFKNITSFKEGSSIDISAGNDWETEVPVGKGNAYGFETYFEKVFGKTLFNINYTYSVSDRLFSDLNNGSVFPFHLNRNHSFKCSFNYRLTQFTEFLVNWTYQSGNYYSRPLNVTFNTSKPTVIFPEKNNATFAPYHRLDAGFSLYNHYKWGRTKLFIGVYNAYNRNNPFYTDLVRDIKNNGKFEFRQFSLITVLPTISYSISI